MSPKATFEFSLPGMSLLDRIEKLQKKDEKAKKKILFVILLIIMASIIFIWLNNLRLKLTSSANVANAPSPIGLIWDALKSNIQDFKQNISK
mgnify:CR=1 FL=1